MILHYTRFTNKTQINDSSDIVHLRIYISVLMQYLNV